jgi:hypothetical protein
LGLGLGPRQRGAFQQAAQAGQGAQFVGTNPLLARRVANRVQVGSPQEARLQNFIGTGVPQGPTPQPRPLPPFPAGGVSPGALPGVIGGNMADRMTPPGPGPGTINGMSPADFQAANPQLYAPGGLFGPSMGPQPMQGWGGGRGGGGAGGAGMFGGFAPPMQNILGARFPGYGGGMMGGGMPNPPSGYGYNAMGGLQYGARPPSAGGIGSNPMMSTATIYPAERAARATGAQQRMQAQPPQQPPAGGGGFL